jgi:predicted CoA-binding protein
LSQTVAIVGASSNRSKFGNKSVRAHQRAGYQVFPIHPTETIVEGLQVYRSVAELPVARLDRVSVYVPPAAAIGVLESLAGRDIGEVWLNPGVDTPEVIAKGTELGLPIVASCSIVALGLSPSQFP